MKKESNNLFNGMSMTTNKPETICIVGLGYVGLPLAVEFAEQKWSIVGFDINSKRIQELRDGHDRTNEIADDRLQNIMMEYSDDPTNIRRGDIVIVTVPTPITKANIPDLSLVESASKIVGENLKKGAVIVFESTVYPGVTEKICVPIIEKESGMKCGVDWKVGYSPERVNPGDTEHTISQIIKVVSGMDEECTEKLARVYGSVCKAGVHVAPNIKTAEAAKVIENIQRDLNIALMNELSLIFKRMGIDTKDVIAAAGTKWNFVKYQPGLVGGHCIGVDPYYLTHRAEELGYHPQVILAGRRVNDSMAGYIAELCIKALSRSGKPILTSRVLILGVTFKEDIPDTRNSKVQDVISALKSYGLRVQLYDPLISEDEKRLFDGEWLTTLEGARDFDAIILATPHKEFRSMSFTRFRTMMAETPILIDIKSIFPRTEAQSLNIIYESL